MTKLLALLNLFRRGSAVADPALLGNKAALGGAIAALLSAAVAAAGVFGYALPIDADTIQALAFGVAAAVSIAHAGLHAAAHPDVGLPAPADGGNDRGHEPDRDAESSLPTGNLG